MFAYELPLEPYCDEWKEYTCPELCKSRIESVCNDILKRGENTRYNNIYGAIYELVQAEIESEYQDEFCY